MKLHNEAKITIKYKTKSDFTICLIFFLTFRNTSENYRLNRISQIQSKKWLHNTI